MKHWMSAIRLRKANKTQGKKNPKQLIDVSKDTLAGRGADGVPRRRRAGHLYGAGEPREQLEAEVLQPLVLFPPIDEHLVLRQMFGWRRR